MAVGTLERAPASAPNRPPDTTAVTPQLVREWEMGLHTGLSPERLRDVINLQREMVVVRAAIGDIALNEAEVTA